MQCLGVTITSRWFLLVPTLKLTQFCRVSTSTLYCSSFCDSATLTPGWLFEVITLSFTQVSSSVDILTDPFPAFPAHGGFIAYSSLWAHKKESNLAEPSCLLLPFSLASIIQCWRRWWLWLELFPYSLYWYSFSSALLPGLSPSGSVLSNSCSHSQLSSVSLELGS